MILFKKVTELHNWLDTQGKKRGSVGFVPTMGALHNGHISLVETSGKENKVTVSSIFVNPTQFNDPADFKQYPITIETDIKMLEVAGCDILFLPSVDEVYPTGPSTRQYDLGWLETVLEGKYRPGHFQGVCMVVERLLNIVNPDKLYLGQKDYQQCMVLQRLIEISGKKDKTMVRICPTLRESDGLAMSSRNMRLNKEERKKATRIYENLERIRKNLKPGNIQELEANAINDLEKNGFRVDYVEIADAKTLQPVTNWDGRSKLVALTAAFLDKVRLIDNMLLN